MATSLCLGMYRCDQLLGMRYRWGGDGSNGEIDCIHMTRYALTAMGVPCPAHDPGWYEMSARAQIRHMRRWGVKVKHPTYDGDVIWLNASGPAFAELWDSGILHISLYSLRVAWLPADKVLEANRFIAYRYCPMSGS